MSQHPPRVPLYERLPEIYRLKDAEQTPPDQLKAFLASFEHAFGAIHANIESLYHDLFIDTCDDWVIPYIADLLGTSHLKGEPWTVRADVADTIALRRRKGTRQAIERLSANLTGWAARAVELRESLAWTQHLNHQRPDHGGTPPLSDPDRTRMAIARGGTVTLRDPAMLSLLGTPFDPFQYTLDTKPPHGNRIACNLPNLAIFLWRLEAYRLRVTSPVFANPGPSGAIGGAGAGEAGFGARFELHPLGRPVRLFNTYRVDPTDDDARLTHADEVPGPIPAARLTSGSAAGNPEAYIDIDPYTPGSPPGGLNLGEAGIQLFVPEARFGGIEWTLRGDTLCAWEDGLRRPLMEREIVIDPDIGRVLFGLVAQDEVDDLRDHLLAGFTYGAVGEIGAHPVDHGPRVAVLGGLTPQVRVVNGLHHADALREAMVDLNTIAGPVLIEIADSLVHDLDLDHPDLASTTSLVDGDRALLIGHSLVIRAADGHRPIIRLAQPLRVRPSNVFAMDPATQEAFDTVNRELTLRFEGVQVVAHAAGSFAPADALIMRAAVARIEVIDTTLDPGGFRERNDDRAPMRAGMALSADYGFTDPNEADAFQPIPDVLIQRSIVGRLAVDEPYQIVVEDSIVDAGAGPHEPAGGAMAVSAASQPATAWGAPLTVRRATFFGAIRVTETGGEGGLFVGPLQVLDNQIGCIKYSWFWQSDNRLPQNHACVDGAEAMLYFTSTWFADPGYGQLSRNSDFRILQRGPGDDHMGASNCLLEAHRWANLNIRLREFMPVGVRPIPLSAT